MSDTTEMLQVGDWRQFPTSWAADRWHARLEQQGYGVERAESKGQLYRYRVEITSVPETEERP